MSRTGLFVVLAGPDGSGKSSLAPRLVAAARRSGRVARHMHWRPGVLPLVGSLVGNAPGDASRPHGREAQGTVLSTFKLLYYWVDFFLGSWIRVRPATGRGGLVVMERGWWDFAVDPQRYRLRVRPGLVRALGRLLPSPDLVLVLKASPEILAGRKDELPAAELERQNDAWRRIELPRTAKAYLDASRSLEELEEEAAARMAEVSPEDTVGAGGVE